MRELKFRAWQPHGSLHREPGMYLVESLHFEPDQEGHGEAFLKPDEGTLAQSSEYFDDIMLMQYTGQDDKNGREVYDQDVCRYVDESGTPQVGIVEWQGYRWALEAIGGDEEGNQDIELHPDYMDEVEVIGNIYQNPELLKTA